MRQLSLRVQIAIVITVMAIALAWLFTVFTAYQSRHALERLSGHLLAQDAQILVDQLDQDLDTQLQLFDFAAALPGLHAPLKEDVVRQVLKALAQQLPKLQWLGLMDSSGKVLYAADGSLEGRSLADHTLFLQAKNQKSGVDNVAVIGAAISKAHIQGAQSQMDISVALFNTDGQLSAVLAGQLSWSWTHQVFQALTLPEQDFSNLDLLLMDKSGLVLLGPEPWLGNTFSPANLTTLSQHRWATLAEGDKSYLSALAKSRHSEPGWQIVLRQPADSSAQAASPFIGRLVWLSVVISLITAGLGWWLSGRISRPIARIARAADRLAAGIPSRIPNAKGSREIEVLSQSITELVASLTQHQSALGAMESLALKDTLTGLPNRSALMKFMNGQHEPVVMFYMDLDGFKGINDSFGHQAGDLVLKEVAKRLNHNIREGDIAVRLGGDEFLVVLQLSAHSQPEQVAQRILTAVASPMASHWGELAVGCSIGGAFWPKDHDDPKTVIAMADQALYMAKSAGKGQVAFYQNQL
ncbi:sensor domain-containing diguanylate cyclase [Gallaecimonas mangrovi]|uniref:sensor domain-containing diguanylate cyclase n=1 Tax=Gallaecimonas mangrovi TaxID=2291597 RepID=UPI000E200A46|nr:diguanylate cyclase [Gallaecimonas mangrovi]